VVRDSALCCVQCLTEPVSKDDAAALSDEALAALVTEFIQLHAEAKQLNDQLEQLKEQLKRHAASQPRMANAVQLRTGEHAVKYGYSVWVSYNAEKLAAVETLLGPEQFAAFFTRKIAFSPVKESLDAFLASEAADTAAARAAILAAAERTEVATVTPVTPKRKTGTSGTPLVPPAARTQP
jgi:cell division septum initiation protein DivIVA